MPTIFKRRWGKIVLVLGVVVVSILFYLWLGATRRGGQQKADPFRIAGNLYYVGANDAELQKLSGAELWISRPDAPIVASGGVKDPTMIFLPVRIRAMIGITSYPEPRPCSRLDPNRSTRHVHPTSVRFNASRK